MLCKVFAAQPHRPEFGSQHLYLGEALCTYTASTGRWEELDSEGLLAPDSLREPVLKIRQNLSVVLCTFNSSSQKAEAGRSL